MSRILHYDKPVSVKKLGIEEAFDGETVDGIMETSKNENIVQIIKSLDSIDKLQEKYGSHVLDESQAKLIHELSIINKVKVDKTTDETLGKIKSLLGELSNLLSDDSETPYPNPKLERKWDGSLSVED